MRLLIRGICTALICLIVAGAVLYRLSGDGGTSRRPAVATLPRTSAGGGDAARSGSTAAGPPVWDLIPGRFEDGGFAMASGFAAPVADPASLAELKASVLGRESRGMAILRARLDALGPDAATTPAGLARRAEIEQSLGQLAMYGGDFAAASGWFRKALDDSKAPGGPANLRSGLTAILGVVALRRGEIDNCIGCVGPSSCIFPIAPEAVHRNPDGSREAVRWFNDYLAEHPKDLRIIWLLNIAAMTLDDYPGGVPPRFRIDAGRFVSGPDAVGRFENVAPRVGLNARGPNLAGGSVFDDFDGDGRPDLFTSSIGAERGASLFLNKGDGTFADRSSSAGLDPQVYALNVRAGDFDNDGRLDVLLLRGGWEKPIRLSLLKNKGDGTFEDVTKAAGLLTPIASETASWSDYDGDGDLDLYVGGEYLPPGPVSPSMPVPDPRNRSRLYNNRGDGTFVDVAAEAGVVNERCAKGTAWGDYNGDGRPDLFVSNMGQPCRLYRNEGSGTFRDVAPELGLTGPDFGFACWFFDFDNDGRPDIYVNDFRASISECIVSALGVSVPNGSRPRLYRNLGPDGFRDVSAEVGLDRAMAPMGVNFGDIDNDGFLDLYVGTGDMSYAGLDRNLMFKNIEGRTFEDVTTSSGTAHLQKGHGVSFADWDADGDLDLFVELGGATPGDRAYNVLFQNPGHRRHWLDVRLVGTRSNRRAIGAKLHADLKGPGGEPRSIYRTIGDNSSFGGNGSTEHLGLRDAGTVDTLTVTWPTGSVQTFRGLAADRTIELTEGSDAVKDATLPKLALPAEKPSAGLRDANAR